MFMYLLCWGSRIAVGILALSGLFSSLYLVLCAGVALTLLFKWDLMRFCQASVWMIVYFTAGTPVAMMVVFVDVAVSFMNKMAPEPAEPTQHARTGTVVVPSGHTLA